MSGADNGTLSLAGLRSAAATVHAAMAPTPQYRWPLLEAQVADLQRTDRVLYEAKRIGMQPREALQYVAIVPSKAPAREIRQASARP